MITWNNDVLHNTYSHIVKSYLFIVCNNNIIGIIVSRLRHDDEDNEQGTHYAICSRENATLSMENNRWNY